MYMYIIIIVIILGCNEDLHSNISNFSSKPPKMRSVADGQSQNSFSNNSMRYLGGTNAYASDLVNSRPGKFTR